MPSVEIVTIGTELLLGAVVDSNSAHIGASLASIGLDVYAKHSVGDNEERLAATLLDALDRSDGVITTGGLGPTVDDLTKEAIARALEVSLELHEPSLVALTERMARTGRVVAENNRRQAILPSGATVMANSNGTAPGFMAFRADGRFIAALPGVPREMRAMLAETLLPWLREHFQLRGGIVMRTIHTAGVPESEIDARIEDLFRAQANPKIAVLAHGGRVDVKVMAKVTDTAEAEHLIAPLETLIRERIGDAVYGFDEETLESVIVRELHAQKLTLACAESCTGGALTDAIVGVAGASRVLQGSIVAYANAAKEKLLAVTPDILLEQGAVSDACAIAMAEGALQAFGVDVAIATTGIAGPDGGSDEKPVGTVFIGIASRTHGSYADRYYFSGDRSAVRSRTVLAALLQLLEFTQKHTV